MDQLRKILGWLKRQHFWVLSVLIALVAIGCWWSAASTLSKEFADNQNAINSEFQKMQQLKGQPFHPNEVINTRQVEETKKQSEEVKKTWQQLYDRQREQVLEWPAALSQEFRDYVEKRKFEDAIPQHLRNNYQNYAERYFPELPKIVGAREVAADASGAGYGGLGGRGEFSRGSYGMRGDESGTSAMLEEDGKYICEWLDQDQALIREQLNFPQRPSAIRIWVTQEDLWVYKTLLNVIKNTNAAAGATRRSNAAVRTIYSLEVGQRAAPYSRTPGRVFRLPSAAPSADMLLGGEGMDPMAAGADGSGRYSDGGASSYGIDSRGGMGMGGDSRGYGGGGDAPMTEAQERAILLNGRYLDAAGKPIMVAGGGDPMMGGEFVDPAAAAAPVDAPTDPAAFGVEYKQLPVRMSLQMDQRWLTYLIAQCANQPLQVEVKEVRINPSDFSSASSGGYSGLGGGGRYEGMGGGSAASLFPDRTGVQTFPAQPNLVNVVVQGVIYIFNEPNIEVLDASQDADALAVTN